MAVHPQPSADSAIELVYLDDLTGLRNRRFLYQAFGEDWADLTEPEGKMSLAIVDLDYFKLVNDTHGHLTGDLVLAETASMLRELLEETDHAIRYGGDEFVLLMPGREKGAAGELMETLRRTMAEKEFVSKEEKQPLEAVLSFSIGVASFPSDGTSGQELMAAADKALYASKKAGRNCVTLSGDLPEELEDEFDLLRTFPAKTVVGRQELIESLGGVCELVNLDAGIWTSLVGPAGVGKTRLLHETLRLGLESGLLSIFMGLSEDLVSQPYSGAARLLAELGYRYSAVFERAVATDNPALLSVLRAHAPDLVSESIEDDAEIAPPPTEDLKEPFLASFRGLAQEAKWLFLIDDVVHLDLHSAELFKIILEEERLPIAVVSAHRTGERESEGTPGLELLQTLQSRPWFEERKVEPLSSDSVGVLIASLLPNHHAPADFDDLVFEITGGNPLFVEEVLRIGIASNRITRRGGEWFVQSVDRDEFPTTLEEAIRRRISLLDGEIEQMISRASALGTSFTSEILQALLGKNEGEILDFLDKARAQGLVQGGKFGGSGEIRFSSSSLRDQAYQTMSEADRVRAHREIGKIEEHRAGSLVGALASRLAYHFERGEVYEKARAYLEAATAAGAPVIVAGSWEESEVPKYRRRRITEAAVPLSDEAWPSVDDVLRSLAHATKSLWMYPEGSPIAKEAFRDLHRRLEGLFEHARVISFAAVEDALVVNGIPYPARRQGVLMRGLLDRLRIRELRGFTIREGMSESEVAFLVSQLASDEPIVRDPEVWAAMLAERGIGNVDFDDRVYVPAEEVSTDGDAPTDARRPATGVIRVAGAAEGDAEDVDGAEEVFAEASKGVRAVAGGFEIALSSDDLRSLVEGMQADEVLHEEIAELVPTLTELLQKLLGSADEQTRFRHESLISALEVEAQQEESGGLDAENPDRYLRLIRSERDPDGKRGLLEPSERRFDAFVAARDLEGARTVLRFIRQCEALDNGEQDLAEEARETLGQISRGASIQVLLEDLSRAADEPDPELLALLRDIGEHLGPHLVIFLQQTEDLRARRAVAGLIRDIGGGAQTAAVRSITHGDNPVVARRVIGVLDQLSSDPAVDLSQAVCVRNPAVLGEAVKLLHRMPREVQLQVIESLMESASPELVSRGVYYLAEWDLVEGKDKFLTLLKASDNAEVLAAVTAAVARWRLPEAVPILGELLGKKNLVRLVPLYPRGLRREFARALAAIDTPEAQETLAEFAKDMDSEVRNIARGLPAPTGA